MSRRAGPSRSRISPGQTGSNAGRCGRNSPPIAGFWKRVWMHRDARPRERVLFRRTERPRVPSARMAGGPGRGEGGGPIPARRSISGSTCLWPISRSCRMPRRPSARRKGTGASGSMVVFPSRSAMWMAWPSPWPVWCRRRPTNCSWGSTWRPCGPCAPGFADAAFDRRGGRDPP